MASIKVFEGEKEDNSENLLLREFKIHLPQKLAGKAKIKIKFVIDEFSLLNVIATEIENEDNSITKIYTYDANNEDINMKNILKVIEPKNVRQIMVNLKNI